MPGPDSYRFHSIIEHWDLGTAEVDDGQGDETEQDSQYGTNIIPFPFRVKRSPHSLYVYGTG